MRTSACTRGKLKDSRRYHSSKNKKKDTRDRTDILSAIRMEAPGNGLLLVISIFPLLRSLLLLIGYLS